MTWMSSRNFYQRVLGFSLITDQRHASAAYVSPATGYCAGRRGQERNPGPWAARRPPAGVELVLEVDDVAGERDHVLAAGWPLEEDLQERPWGLTDFRILDPAGYYLRITGRAPA